MFNKQRYERLCQDDLITPIAEDINAGVFRVTKDWKLAHRIEDLPSIKTPWIFSGTDTGRCCKRWMLYFSKYGIISRNCFNCWKTVTRPRNVNELFKLLDLQTKLKDEGQNSKCGIERRPVASWKNFYGGFWYNPLEDGLEGARENTKKIVEAIRNEIAEDFPVILKRACTEMELAAGPSNEWTLPAWQKGKEDAMDALFEIPEPNNYQPFWVKNYIKRQWLEYAFENQDSYAKEFVKNFPEDFGVKPDLLDYYKGRPLLAQEKG